MQTPFTDEQDATYGALFSERKKLAREKEENRRLVEVISGIEATAVATAVAAGDGRAKEMATSGLLYAIGDREMPAWLAACLAEIDGEEPFGEEKSSPVSAFAVFDRAAGETWMTDTQRETLRSDFGSALLLYEVGVFGAEDVVRRLPKGSYGVTAWARRELRGALR